ncbi:MAG: glycosyltransferase family 9 protein [Chthoniobacterales bacterium]
MNAVPDGPNILIIKPGSLGDIIHALPSASWIKKQWPQAHLHWIVDTRWKPLLIGQPHIDHLVDFPRTRFRGVGAAFRFFSWLKSLETLRPDLTIDLQGLLRSGLMARAAKSKQIIGGDDAREGAGHFYHKSARIAPKAHGVERYRSILQTAGIDTESTPPIFKLPESKLPVNFEPSPPFVLLHTLSRGKGKSLSPSASDFLKKALTPLRVVLVGQDSSRKEANKNDPDDLINRSTLTELLALCRAAHFIISVDSGPAHLAAAVNPNTLAIHSWSDPRRVGPWEKSAFVWKNGHISRVAELSKIKGNQLNCNSPLPTENDLTQIANFVKHKLPD